MLYRPAAFGHKQSLVNRVWARFGGPKTDKVEEQQNEAGEVEKQCGSNDKTPAPLEIRDRASEHDVANARCCRKYRHVEH